jgi:membrane protein DedA with SNARE-associated domain
MHEFLTHFSYVGVAAVLLALGFGFPLPEDIPLLTGGYLCGIGHTHIEIMMPVCLAAVLGADAILYYLGRRYGHHVPRLPVLRRYLTESRLAKAERTFHDHGGKALFVARFLPGVRSACFFTAGTFKIPFWKFMVYDGSAALISVPTLVWLGWLGGRYFGMEQVKKWAAEGQFAVISGIVVVIVLFIAWKIVRARRRMSKVASQPPNA